MALGFGHFDLDLERLIGRHLLGCGQRHVELAVAPLQWQVHQAQRPCRGDASSTLLAGTARTQHHGGDVEVVAFPCFVQRNVDGGAIGAHAQSARPQQLVTLHRDQGFTGMGGGEGEFGSVCVGVGGLVKLQGHAVGAHALGFVVFGRPTGVEAELGGQLGFGVQDLYAVAAVFDWHHELAARACRDRDLCGGHQFVRFGIARMPAALVVKAPVPVAVLAEDAHGQRCTGAQGSGGVGNGHLEVGIRPFAGIGAHEQRAQTHQNGGGPVGALDTAHHRAATAFQQAERCAHGKRRAALLHRAQVHAHVGLAFVVQGGFL